jgi:hypothetical protein
VQNKRITEDEKEKLREMLERERGVLTARSQRPKITKEPIRPWVAVSITLSIICCTLPAVVVLTAVVVVLLTLDTDVVDAYGRLGILLGLGFFLSCIVPLLGIISVILAIIAIIKAELKGKTLALAIVAIVLGILYIVVGLYVCMIFFLSR